ncbi:MAG: hypothetical protein ACD_74C00040G0001, partial [uncultured bacterium]
MQANRQAANPAVAPCSSSTVVSAGIPPIKGFLETSFIDWPGKLCAILFVGGCN